MYPESWTYHVGIPPVFTILLLKCFYCLRLTGMA